MNKIIAFHVGYYKKDWNYESPVLGGTERVILNITQQIKINNPDYRVIISGDVISGNNNGVEFINTKNEYTVTDIEADVLICVNYISGLLYYPKAKNKIMYFHNTDYYPYFLGNTLDGSDLILRESFDSYICLTYWHKETMIVKYNLERKKVLVIPHGITDDFNSDNRIIKEIKDDSYIRFIWMSAAERGLTEHINYFTKVIKSVYSNSELIVCSPKYSENWFDYSAIKDISGVRYIGYVADIAGVLKTCHAAIYITDYQETFCLSVQEMIASGLFVVTSDVAALKETNVNSYFASFNTTLSLIKNKINYFNRGEVKRWKEVYNRYWEKII